MLIGLRFWSTVKTWLTLGWQLIHIQMVTLNCRYVWNLRKFTLLQSAFFKHYLVDFCNIIFGRNGCLAFLTLIIIWMFEQFFIRLYTFLTLRTKTKIRFISILTFVLLLSGMFFYKEAFYNYEYSFYDFMNFDTSTTQINFSSFQKALNRKIMAVTSYDAF